MNQKAKIMELCKRKVIRFRFVFILSIIILIDGTIVRYFTCNDNHGLYVRPGQIESVINDLQPDLVRSASNHSIQSIGSSTGSIPQSSSNSAIPRTSALPAKQTGLRPPVSSGSSKLPGKQ